MSAALAILAAASLVWPEPTKEMKPWVYNWWMGSAVDEAGMELQCRELADRGFGGFHVIPIYGAKNGWERKWKPLLSEEWIAAWNMAAGKAKEHSLGIDLTMGSGWCFGGPWIDKRHAASSGMMVKRAGLGGTGYMIDPFDPEAMKIHVAQFDKWFGKDGKAARPRAFYHDSYEYYGAEPKQGQDVDASQLKCFQVWTDWCRENGYLTRNEAHGAPSNWLDFYALADIPETEMFGDADRDILVSKFASSAAHAKGTVLVSAEACTWIDEHFRERPQEIKQFLDRLFLAGVNHVFYHGCCYSPVDVAWPGWCFYASLEMNPRNPIWREMGALNAYVTRCQSLFQTWTPDNDLALIWDPAPYRAKHPGKTMNMSIHNRGEWFYGEKIGKLAKELYEAGYAFDYVSPRMVEAGLAKKYAAVVDPEGRGEAALQGARKMPFNAASGLLATRWKKDGETGYFVVNTGAVARTVAAVGRPFGVMDPLTGKTEAARCDPVEIAPAHSLFLVTTSDDPQFILDQHTDLLRSNDLRDSEALVQGAGCSTKHQAPSTKHYPTTLSLGEVHEIARVKLNGRDLGVRFMAPYRLDIPPGVLREKGNVLEVEVTNLGANRLRWNDLNGVDWKYFSDINMVGRDYKRLDASKWKPLPSGLMGPVEVSFASAGDPKRLRPLMGWSSWNTFGCEISEDVILETARAMATNGLKAAGYTYVNIDDGFFDGHGDDGVLRFHPRRFPRGMKPVVDGIHALGLKAGIYSDAGADTCGSMYRDANGEYDRGGIGSGLYGHDAADCKLHFNDLGFDFIKVDYCGGNRLGLDERTRYSEIAKAIKATGRSDVRLNICRWAFPGTWAADIAESWRTTGDIRANWGSLKKIVKENLYLSAYASPGHFNDMDMLEVGHLKGSVKTAFGKDDGGLTPDEEAMHFGVWCILSSPLLIGCDVRSMPRREMELVTNPYLLAMNQNDLGLQAYVAQRVARDGYVLVKDADRRFGPARYVALVNLADEEQEFAVAAETLDLGGAIRVFDLLDQCAEDGFEGKFTLKVRPHAARFFRFDAERRLERTVYEAETAYLTAYQELHDPEKLGTAFPVEAKGASGGVVVRLVGKGEGNDLIWKDVMIMRGGRRTLVFGYSSSVAGHFLVQVDGGERRRVEVGATDGAFAEVRLDVDLSPGLHSIRISNPDAIVPDIDVLLMQ